jgi:hypothetical protein
VGKGGNIDKGNKNREGDMEIRKPRERKRNQ